MAEAHMPAALRPIYGIHYTTALAKMEMIFRIFVEAA